jgi:plastocyanin
MTRNHSRRNWLKTLGLAGSVIAGVSLAGCTTQGSNDENGGNDAGGDDSTPTESNDSGDGGSQTNTVEMTDDLKFAPEEIEIPAGTTVTWKNVGSIGHTVTAYEDKIPDGATYFASGGFDSEQAAKDGYPDKGNITEGRTYEHTFETKGTYEYYCIPHEMNGMVGTVEVV